MTTPEKDSLELIRQAIEKFCEAPRDSIVPSATLSDLNVDSLSLAEMLFSMEDTLGASIPEPAERPQTVADLMALIQPYVGELTAQAVPA